MQLREHVDLGFFVGADRTKSQFMTWVQCYSYPLARCVASAPPDR